MVGHKPYPLQIFTVLVGLTILSNVLLLIPSCSSRNPKKDREQSLPASEDLIRTNQKIVKDQSAEIEAYLTRRGYKMILTPTGLRYMIYDSSKTGIKPITDDIVEVEYKISLLDGTEIYNSDSTGLLKFQLDKSEVASGFQEAVKYMYEGNRALMIIPAHLAYGLTGDGNKISYYEALVVDTKLVKVE